MRTPNPDPASFGRPANAVAVAAALAFVLLTCAFPGASFAADANDAAAVPAAKADNGDAAPEAAPKPAELAPIVVDATRPAAEKALVERSFETPEDVAGFGETIFAEPTWRSFESTSDLLGQSVGAQLRRQGGRDDFSTLSIRGAPSGQVRILLDGVPLGRAADSVVNLADLPMDTIDRIEVYRGFAPASLTPTSSAGVVNIVSRDPGGTTASAAAGGGSFGSAKANVGAAQPLLGGAASAFASYRRTDGDFRYVDDNGTRFNRSDDHTETRANNDSQAVDNLLRWRGNVGRALRVQLRNQVFYKDEGVPGPAAFPRKARLETVRDIAAASIGAADGRWSVEQGATLERRTLRNYQPFDNRGETSASSTTARWGRPIGKANWFSGSADYTWEKFGQSAPASTAKQRATRSSLAVAAGDDWTVSPLATTLSVQLRHQQLWDDRSGSAAAGSGSAHSTDPRAGLRWEPLGGLAIKANVSTYFRPPNFDELFGTNGFTIGNPDLKPESGLSHDAGFEWTVDTAVAGRIAVGYSWFGSSIDDIILVRLTPDRMAKALNAARARVRGHEARLEWQGPWGLAVSTNYTHQDAENRSSAAGLRGKDLAGLAPDEAWTRISWAKGTCVVAYDIDVTGAHYTDSENAEPILPTRVVHGVSMVVGPFWKGLRLTLEAENLGDTLVPDQIGFPLPGRSFYATLSWSMEARENRDAS